MQEGQHNVRERKKGIQGCIAPSKGHHYLSASNLEFLRESSSYNLSGSSKASFDLSQSVEALLKP